jgi:hypothetical protein
MKTLVTFLSILFATNIIGQTSPITFSIISIGESCTGCCDGSINVTNVQGDCALPNSFSLNPGGLFSGNGLFQNLCSMNYTVTVQDMCGSTTSNTICVDFSCPLPTYVNEISVTNKNIKFDNLSNTLIVESVVTNTKIKICDISGKIISEHNLIIGNNKFDYSTLTTGLYFISVLTDDNVIGRKKIIKN